MYSVIERVAAGEHEAVAAGPARGRSGRGAGSRWNSRVGRRAPGSSPCRGGRSRPPRRRPWPGPGRRRRRGGRAPTSPGVPALVSGGVGAHAGLSQSRGTRSVILSRDPTAAVPLRPRPDPAPARAGLCRRAQPGRPGRQARSRGPPVGSGGDDARRPACRRARRPRWRGVRATGRAYVALTKPRVIELLLVTTVPTMVLAARGLPDARRSSSPRCVGGSLAAGERQRLNCWYDQDIDVAHAPHRAPAARPARRQLARRAGLRPGARRRRLRRARR